MTTQKEMQQYSNQTLLALLVGKRKARVLGKTPLSTLLSTEVGNADYVPELAIAKELVMRSLEENLFQGNALTSPQLVRDYLKVILNGREAEAFVALFLDTQHRLITCEELFQGTLSQTSVYPREVVKRSLAVNAASVIFAHNHPSGVAEPSRADELLTHSLKQALALVDVKVLDHFVVAGNETLSMAERGIV